MEELTGDTDAALVSDGDTLTVAAGVLLALRVTVAAGLPLLETELVAAELDEGEALTVAATLPEGLLEDVTDGDAGTEADCTSKTSARSRNGGSVERLSGARHQQLRGHRLSSAANGRNAREARIEDY